MIVLYNYGKGEKGHIPSFHYELKKRSYSAGITEKTMTITELMKAAKAVKASAVIVSNAGTLKNLTGQPKATLDEWRGSLLKFDVPVLIINPIINMFTVNHGRWLLGTDLDKLMIPGFTGPSHKRIVVKRTSQLHECLTDMNNAVLAAVDIETNGEELDKYYNRKSTKQAIRDGSMSLEVKPIYITSISVSLLMKDATIKSYAIAFTGFKDEVWSVQEFALVIKWLRAAMDHPIPKVFHNGIYDCTHLINYRADPRNYVWDTMGCAHAQYAELPKSLDFVASYLFPHYSYWKYKSTDAAKSGDISQLLTYNMDDTYWTLMIAIVQMCNSDQWVHVNNVMTFKMLYPFLYSGYEGAKIDNKVRLEVLEEANSLRNASLKKLRIMTHDSKFNPGSWQQLEDLFYKTLGAKKPWIGKSKSCTDSKNRAEIAKQHPLIARFVTEVDVYKEQDKAIGTYFLYRQRNGRLLYELNPWGTETGRAASRASNFNCGTQWQNIPYYGKKQLIPDEDFIWVNPDFSKAEAVCTAYISFCKALIQAVTDKEKDFYKNLAVIFFHFIYEDVSTEFRNKVMKKIVHGTNYMMGAKTFTENMGIENMMKGAEILGISLDNSAPKLNRGKCADRMKILDFANFLIETYHGPFPEIRKWYKATAERILRDGRITSVMGWTRIFFGDPRRHHAVLRSAVAHQPQNLSVFLLNRAMRNVYDNMVINPRWLGDFRLKGQVHDSLPNQIRKARLLEGLNELHKHMTVPLKFPNIEEPMIINVDFEISSTSYGKLTPVERVNGQFILPDVF